MISTSFIVKVSSSLIRFNQQTASLHIYCILGLFVDHGTKLNWFGFKSIWIQFQDSVYKNWEPSERVYALAFRLCFHPIFLCRSMILSVFNCYSLMVFLTSHTILNSYGPGSASIWPFFFGLGPRFLKFTNFANIHVYILLPFQQPQLFQQLQRTILWNIYSNFLRSFTSTDILNHIQSFTLLVF